MISVVVPTRGRPAYLERCLAALARSDYPEGRFEVLVVNDRGGPEVERVVRLAPDGIRARLVDSERSGPSAARNAGALAARGRFIAFTDDDCEPAPGWLGALEGALAANPGAAVGGETRNGVPASSGAAASQLVVDAVHAHFNRDPDAPRFFASYNVAFPAEPFRALGGFDERFRYAEDREMCERWLRAGNRFAHAPEALVHHMRTPSPREFLRQHYGYGRGASAFHRAGGAGAERSDRIGVLRALVRELQADGVRARPAVALYVALSQLATAAGIAREAASRLPFLVTGARE
jgi:glycosyltransferase involved in cell wall biosynthesis